VRRALVVVALLFVSAVALAQQLPERRITVAWEQGIPKLDFDASDVIDRDARAAIERGVTRRVRVSVDAYRPGSSDAIASRSFGCAITRDVWEARYQVRLGRRLYRYRTMDEAIGRCLQIRGLGVGRAADYRGGNRVFFTVRAEFNPIGRARCQQRLQSSAREGELFGPVVITMVRRDLCRADRVVQFRSQQVRVRRGGS